MAFLRRTPFVLTVAFALAGSPAAWAAGPSLSITRNGPGMTATLSNAGTAGVTFNYDPGHNGACADQNNVPCFQFHGGDGTAPIPMSAPGCKTIDSGNVECIATGIASLMIVLKNGGSALTTCSSGSCASSDCFGGLTIKAQGAKNSVYQIKTVDGCLQTVICAGGMGTVEADPADTVRGCSFVQRQNP